MVFDGHADVFRLAEQTDNCDVVALDVGHGKSREFVTGSMDLVVVWCKNDCCVLAFELLRTTSLKLGGL